MSIYIALLRGINVGGHNKIKMADLKGMFQSMGFNRVQTYIQSGNILFESTVAEDALRQRIEQEIEKVYSISLTVILRTSAELEQIIANCPFSEAVLREAEAATEVETFYISMLLESPRREEFESLRTYTSEIDEFRMGNREIYLLLRDGVRNSKLVSHLSKLSGPSTMRNWKTINKLNDLAKSLEVGNK